MSRWWGDLLDALRRKPRRKRRVRPVGNVADRMERLLLFILTFVIVGSILYMGWRTL